MTVAAVNCITVYVTRCCSRDIEDGLPGADGWQPKSPRTTSGRGNRSTNRLHRRNDNTHNKYSFKSKLFGVSGVREAEALPEEVNLDSSVPEAIN